MGSMSMGMMEMLRLIIGTIGGGAAGPLLRAFLASSDRCHICPQLSAEALALRGGLHNAVYIVFLSRGARLCLLFLLGELLSGLGLDGRLLLGLAGENLADRGLLLLNLLHS